MAWESRVLPPARLPTIVWCPTSVLLSVLHVTSVPWLLSKPFSPSIVQGTEGDRVHGAPLPEACSSLLEASVPVKKPGEKPGLQAMGCPAGPQTSLSTTDLTLEMSSSQLFAEKIQRYIATSGTPAALGSRSTSVVKSATRKTALPPGAGEGLWLGQRTGSCHHPVPPAPALRIP